MAIAELARPIEESVLTQDPARREPQLSHQNPPSLVKGREEEVAAYLRARREALDNAKHNGGKLNPIKSPRGLECIYQCAIALGRDTGEMNLANAELVSYEELVASLHRDRELQARETHFTRGDMAILKDIKTKRQEIVTYFHASDLASGEFTELRWNIGGSSTIITDAPTPNGNFLHTLRVRLASHLNTTRLRSLVSSKHGAK